MLPFLDTELLSLHTEREARTHGTGRGLFFLWPRSTGTTANICLPQHDWVSKKLYKIFHEVKWQIMITETWSPWRSGGARSLKEAELLSNFSTGACELKYSHFVRKPRDLQSVTPTFSQGCLYRSLVTRYIENVPRGKVNILGGHRIGHSKQQTTYVHVFYSERFLRYSYFTVQYFGLRLATRHILTRVAKCIYVDCRIFENLLY
jgi:hypothetical protein